jgi:hypothetical protein
LTDKLRILIPELLEANHVLTEQPGTLTFELTSHRQELLTLVS